MIYDTEKECEEWRYKFAGMVLQGMITNGDGSPPKKSDQTWSQATAEFAVKCADELLAALEEK